MSARHDFFERYEINDKIKNLPCVISRQSKTGADGIGCPNWHDALELQLCRSGSGYIIIGGKRLGFTEGEIAVINSDCTHYTGSEDRIEFIPLIISADFCKNAGIDCRSLIFESLIKDNSLNQLFSRTVDIYFSPDSPYKKAQLQSAVLEILIKLRKSYTITERPATDGNKSFEQTQIDVAYIREHYKERLSLDLIAKNSFTDKYRLSRSFKAFTGMTVVRYINEYRCEEAAKLIRDGMPVGEAALQCGFNNISFFTKVFKKSIGMLPSEIRG